MSEATFDRRSQPRREFRYDPSEVRDEGVFVEARRHSSRVRWLKIVLPALAGACMVAFVVTIKIATSDIAELFSLANISMDTKSLVMDQPHLSGFKGTEHSYEIHADRAVQDLANPKVVRLEQIKAEFGLTKEVKVSLGATAGIFDGDNEKLELKDGITVSSNNGYAARLDSAFIDFRTKQLTSEGTIEISANEGLIRSRTLTIGEEGKKVSFGGGVSMTFVPPADGSSAFGEMPTVSE